MSNRGRNRYVLTIDVELTHPLNSEYAKPAAELLAADVRNWLKNHEWGYGRARVETVYAPSYQFAGGDFAPEEVSA